MSNYTRVMVSGGFGETKTLEFLASIWEAQIGGPRPTVVNDPPMLVNEVNYLNEHALREVLMALNWGHSEYVQVWLWREGDGEWVEQSWMAGEWYAVDASYRERVARAEAVAIALSDDVPLSADQNTWLYEMKLERAREQKRKDDEAQWRKEWKLVIERRAQEIMKESA